MSLIAFKIHHLAYLAKKFSMCSQKTRETYSYFCKTSKTKAGVELPLLITDFTLTNDNRSICISITAYLGENIVTFF